MHCYMFSMALPPQQRMLRLFNQHQTENQTIVQNNNNRSINCASKYWAYVSYHKWHRDRCFNCQHTQQEGAFIYQTHTKDEKGDDSLWIPIKPRVSIIPRV